MTALATTHNIDSDRTVRAAASTTRPEPTVSCDTPSSKARWTGRILSGLGVAFLTFDATLKLVVLPAAVEGARDLGYPGSVVLPLGIVQLACLILYLVPRTSLLGAILWTGYLGGAVATHVRVDNPLFSHMLFPIYIALLLWGGLWLRDLKLRALLPLRADASRR